MAGAGWAQAVIEAVKVLGTIGGAVGHFINAGKIKRQLRRMGEPRYNPAAVPNEYYTILSRLSKRADEGYGAGALAAQHGELSRQADMARKRMGAMGAAGLAGLYMGLANRNLMNATNQLFMRNQDVRLAAQDQYNNVLSTIGGMKYNEGAKKAQADFRWHYEMYKTLSKLRADSIRAGWSALGSLFAGGSNNQPGGGTVGGLINAFSKQKVKGEDAGGNMSGDASGFFMDMFLNNVKKGAMGFGQ